MVIDIDNTDKLLKTLELRKKELNETTRQAASAIAVGTLKSLRADTKVANVNRNKIVVRESIHKVVYNGRDDKWLVVNANGRPVKLYDKLIVLMQPTKGLRAKLFHCENFVTNEKVRRYYVIAASASDAKKLVKEIASKAVSFHKGLAKLALGVAMAKIAAQSLNDSVTADAKVLASNLTDVQISETGFNDGSVSIKIRDMLDYAAYALKSGQGYVAEAQNKAMNKTLGLIAQKLKQSGRVDESLDVKRLISQV